VAASVIVPLLVPDAPEGIVSHVESEVAAQETVEFAVVTAIEFGSVPPA